MLMVLPTSGQQAARLVGYYLISVYPGITTLIYSWSAANTAGDTKRKCTSAVLFIGQSVGNVVGPLLYKPAEAPRYTRGLTSNLVLYCVIVVLVVLVSLYLAFLNRSHSKRRVAMGKSAVIIDTSLFSAAEAEKAKQEQAAQAAGDNGNEMAAAGEEQAEENERHKNVDHSQKPSNSGANRARDNLDTGGYLDNFKMSWPVLVSLFLLVLKSARAKSQLPYHARSRLSSNHAF
ncbi:hypothetical protein BDP81DRAFT_470403 [Colletotrichum phormii]|uniref:Transporter n=1 Tax=Colletotrichum phormii TaxID=359342 RepID=A0AAI9ZWA8_9PEZI|nr:uncharacterized protein BDP81DRAFT_470403 [Colletotrichum phormii]KAK1638024.1 hypothetical protein BDP81DRAFT_470403 [Colletotrichum phormii]